MNLFVVTMNNVEITHKELTILFENSPAYDAYSCERESCAKSRRLAQDVASRLTLAECRALSETTQQIKSHRTDTVNSITISK